MIQNGIRLRIDFDVECLQYDREEFACRFGFVEINLKERFYKDA
jgi:hypothetical protein